MIELLMQAWALFVIAALFAAGIVVALAGLAVVFGPIAWVIWYFTKDEDDAKFVARPNAAPKDDEKGTMVG